MWQPKTLRWSNKRACLAGILMAAVADNQLHRFMQGNERRNAAGKAPELLLDTGGATQHPSCVYHPYRQQVSLTG